MFLFKRTIDYYDFKILTRASKIVSLILHTHKLLDSKNVSEEEVDTL
jgi:hypothetical protein